MNIGSKKFPTTFSLADSSMNIVTCTLWDDYAKQFIEGYNALGAKGPVIVVLKHANIKGPQGLYDLTISNAWIGTKIIMDQDLKEIQDFIKCLPADFVSQIQDTQNNAVDGGLFTLNSQGSQFSSGSRYAYKAPATHLSRILCLPEEEFLTTVATPHHVCVSKNSWYYLSCAECSKAIITDAPPYKCKTTSHVTPNPIIRYRVEVEVRFDGHKCKFLLWDRESAQLIGKSAAELKDLMMEGGDFDPHEYPKDLDNMMGTELAFKFKVQSNGKMATVINYRTDPEIIQHIKDQLLNAENSEQLTLLPPISGETSNMSVEHLAGISEEKEYPTLDLSATGESEPDEILMKTPAKRTVQQSFPEYPSGGKLSSNKMTIKNIKKEKVSGAARR